MALFLVSGNFPLHSYDGKYVHLEVWNNFLNYFEIVPPENHKNSPPNHKGYTLKISKIEIIGVLEGGQPYFFRTRHKEPLDNISSLMLSVKTLNS